MAADSAYNSQSKILSLFKPTILLDEISIADTESADQQDTVSEDHAKPSKVYGNIAPYIRINGFTFNHNSIKYMTLSETGFMPTIEVTLRDTKGIFKSAYFPKQQPILSLYIRSKHDKLKCIRCDFLVTKVRSNSSIDENDRMNGTNMEFDFSGVLLVPEIYSNIPKAYSKMTSMEVLQRLSADMQLGFASNETYTNDNMTWLKPLIAKNKFIQHVLVHSFKDDSSFYTGFIDKYYHLNFVNVARMFDENGDMDKLYQKLITYDDLYTRQSETDSDDTYTDLILTNLSKVAKSDLYLKEFRPESSTGNRLINSGYVRSVSYYDQMLSDNPEDNLVSLDVSPISQSLKPGDEDPAQKNLKKLASNLSYGEWVGVDYNNGHDNFQFSLLQNAHNNREIRKVTLYAKLDGVNLNIIRGMRVPVIIVRQGVGEAIDSDSMLMGKDQPVEGVDKSGEVTIVRDKWLSGYYVVGALRYNYSYETGFDTEMTLLRMNWDEAEAKIRTDGEKSDTALPIK